MNPYMTASLANLQDYIRTVATLRENRPEKKREMPFITISRQAGAGGHTLAEEVIKEMAKHPNEPLFSGWQILDQELCSKALEDADLRVSLETLLTENFRSEMEDYLSQIISGSSPQMAVFHKTARIVRTFAGLGKVIIVGRAGSLLTRDLQTGIHVRLVASKESRVKRMMEEFNLSWEEARRQVKEQDLSRALLVRTYFNGKDIDDPALYDIVWNTDHVPFSSIASCLVQKVEDMASHKKALAA